MNKLGINTTLLSEACHGRSWLHVMANDAYGQQLLAMPWDIMGKMTGGGYIMYGWPDHVWPGNPTQEALDTYWTPRANPDFPTHFNFAKNTCGVQYIREQWPLPEYFWGVSALMGTQTAVVNDALGWETIDNAVMAAAANGQKLQLDIPQPWSPDWGYGLFGGSADLNKYLTLWALPWATYMAERYKDYWNTVSLNGGNEMDGGFGIDTAGIATYQIAIYDAIKAVDSRIRVTTPESNHAGGLVALLNQLRDRGAASKFDDFAIYHYYWPYDPMVDDTWVEDAEAVKAALSSMGRNDVKVRIGEFDYSNNGFDLLTDDYHAGLVGQMLSSVGGYFNAEPAIGCGLLWTEKKLQWPQVVSAYQTINTVADTVAPTVTLALGAASGLTVTVTLTANETGCTFILKESAVTPTIGWGAAPTSYTFATEGTKTLYAWAKDAAGNISNYATATVNISLPVVIIPPVTTSAKVTDSTGNTQTVATDSSGINPITFTDANGNPY